MNRRNLIFVVAMAGLVIGSVVWFLADDPRTERASAPTDVVDLERDGSDTGVGSVARVDLGTDSSEKPAAPEGTELQLAFVDEVSQPVAADDVTIGAPGMYPPLETSANGAGQLHVTLPAVETSKGDDVRTVEVLARHTHDPLLAAWTQAERGDERQTIVLQPAHRLSVQVVSVSGFPIRGALVRLARGQIGLVNITETTAEGGTATFASIPPGDYVLSVRAPGFLHATADVAVPGDRQHTVVLDHGRVVMGSVRGPSGDPVPNAVVSVHVDTSGFAAPDMVISGVPAAVVGTDMLGNFSSDGVPSGLTRVVGLHDDFASAASDAVDTSLTEGPVYLDVTLGRGFDAEVIVRSESGDPVRGARVAWHDPTTAAGYAALTDVDGRARFTSVPRGAIFEATYGRWESLPESLGRPEPDGTMLVELTLQKSGAGQEIRLRVEPDDPDVRIEAVEARLESGAVCTARHIEEDDWSLTECAEGTATLSVRTEASGTHQQEVELVDGMDVSLPEPASVTVHLEGSPEERWNETTLEVDDGTRWRRVELRRTDDRRSTWEGTLYHGNYRVRASNSRIGSVSDEMLVGGDAVEKVVPLISEVPVKLYVLDEQNAPVTGAHVSLWSVDGELLDVARSGGQLPTTFRERPPTTARVLAVDPRRGEASAEVEFGADTERLELVLAAPVLAHDVPHSRVSRADAADILGAALVSQDDGFQIDVTNPASRAAAAGIERGEYLVSLWRGRDAFRVIVWNRSDGYRDIELAK